MKFEFKEKDFFEELIGLLKIKSENRDTDVTEASPLGEGVHKAIKYVLDIGEKFGFKTKDIDGYCGYVEMGEGEEMLGLLTHVDTVPIGNGWRYEPFDGTIDNGKIYGRGTCDDKGPTIMCLYAMKAIKDSGIPLNKRIRLIIGGDEESGIWKCMERYKQTEEIPTCAFSPDATYPATYAEKGILRIRIFTEFDENVEPIHLKCGIKSNMVPAYASAEIAGVKYEAEGKAAHSMAPELGVNALIILCEKLREIGINHPFLRMIQIVNVDGLNIALSDEPSGKLTINPSMAEVNEKKGELVCDIRYPVTLNTEAILSRISDSLKPYGFEVEKISGNEPLYLPKDLPFIECLQKVYKEVTDDNTEPISTGGCTYARAFPNAVAFGVMFPTTENTCHKANEFWSLDEIRLNFKVITQAIIALNS